MSLWLTTGGRVGGWLEERTVHLTTSRLAPAQISPVLTSPVSTSAQLSIDISLLQPLCCDPSDGAIFSPLHSFYLVVRLVLAGPCVWCHDPGPVVPPQLGAAQGWSHNYSIVCSRPAPAADTPQQYTHAPDHRVQGDESVGDFMCIFCIKHVFTYPSCSI